jgi:hypothetical protein
MKHKRYAMFAMGVALLFAAAPFPVNAKDEYRLVTALGDVKIITGKTERPAVRGEALAGGQTIVTGGNSMADLSLGSRGIMRIQENSKIAVASLEKGAPDLDVGKGGILVVMSKLIKGESYQVKTPTQVASVRGTIFQVAGDESKSQLDVFTGSVMVNPVSNGAIQTQITQMVTEGKSLSLDKTAVLNLLQNKNKISLAAIRSDVRQAFVKQATALSGTSQFKNLNADTRKELVDRVQKMREEIKSKIGNQQALKEKLLEQQGLKGKGLDQQSLKDKLKDRKQEIIDELQKRSAK